jgi:hypothetical protein
MLLEAAVRRVAVVAPARVAVEGPVEQAAPVAVAALVALGPEALAEAAGPPEPEAAREPEGLVVAQGPRHQAPLLHRRRLSLLTRPS